MLDINWRRPLLLESLRLLRPVTYAELMLLRRLDRVPAEEIRALHECRLEALLRHAYEQTDYYHEVLGECGVVRDGKVDLGQFERLPVLTKAIMREQGPRLRARQLPPGRRVYENKTGGSTGEPTRYWQDSYYWDINVATKLHHFEVLGKQLGEPEFKLWGSDRDLVVETALWQRRLQNWLYHRHIMTCAVLTEPQIEAIIAEIDRFRPKSIWGYIDGLYTVAQYVNRTGRKPHPPRAVLGGGGTLLPPMAAAIRQAFGAPPANLYGSREMGDVACECPAGEGLHISLNSHKVEVTDAAGRSVVEEDGDLVLTSVHNYAMPFIRYHIGDRGRLTHRVCSCGRGFPLLENVSGRAMESFVRADGAIVSPIYMITAVGGLTEPDLIERVQFVQEGRRQVVVRFVPTPRAEVRAIEAHLERLRQRLQGIIGGDCAVRFERVADIPPTASGKYLYTVSKVTPEAPSLERFSA
jgi:phenylacetate-CoA ligase